MTDDLIDLSHPIEDGMITYRGIPAPVVCDFLSREASREVYAEGTEFHIGRIDLVANTGTYIDSPFHRFPDTDDIADLRLEQFADIEGVVIRVTGAEGRAVDRAALLPYEVRDRAVLVHTGWDAHWRTDRYFEGHPFLTADAATHLVEQGARLVGIDSLNIDDTADGTRPVHTALLGAGIPIVEHLRGLEQLPVASFRFTAAPPPVRGMGTFPVRAFARLQGIRALRPPVESKRGFLDHRPKAGPRPAGTMLSMTTTTALARRITLVPDPSHSSAKAPLVRRLRLARFEPETRDSPGVERYRYLKRMYD